MIVLKARNLSAWQKNAAKLPRLVPGQQKTETWGDPQMKAIKTLVLHYVVCEETWTDVEGLKRKSTWAWVSSERVSKKNLVTRCHRMARQRWDNEEPILVEKHHSDYRTHRRVFIKDPGGSLRSFSVAASMKIATPNSTSLVLLEESCP